MPVDEEWDDGISAVDYYVGAELVLTDMLFEVSIEFVSGTKYANANEIRPVDGLFSNMTFLNQNFLMKHAVELLRNNVEMFSRIQVWIDEFDDYLFLLIPRSHLRDEVIEEMSFIGAAPPESAFLVDTISATETETEP